MGEKKKKRSRGRFHSWVRVVSSLVRQVTLNAWVKTDLAFPEFLCGYPFSDQKLALLAFYLTIFVPEDLFWNVWCQWHILLQNTKAVHGRRLQPPCPPLPSTLHRWGASVTLGLWGTLRTPSRMGKLATWVLEFVSTLLPMDSLLLLLFMMIVRRRTFHHQFLMYSSFYFLGLIFLSLFLSQRASFFLLIPAPLL